jgi:hypothetical protein
VTPAEVLASQNEVSASHTSAPAALATKPPQPWAGSAAPQNCSVDHSIAFSTERWRSIFFDGKYEGVAVGRHFHDPNQDPFEFGRSSPARAWGPVFLSPSQ